MIFKQITSENIFIARGNKIGCRCQSSATKSLCQYQLIRTSEKSSQGRESIQEDFMKKGDYSKL